MKKLLLTAVGLVILFIAVLLGYRIVDRLTWKEGHTDILIIGIDGADWQVIDKLIEEGSLPNIESLLKRGVRADLKSINPLLTPRIWTTIGTGKVPVKHGVKDFYATSHDVRSKRIWDIIEDQGWSIGVFAWPITWPPPSKVNGFMVPDWMARGTETYPPELSFLKKMEAEARAQEQFSSLLKYALKGYTHGISLVTLLNSARYVIGQKLFPSDYLDRYVELRRLQQRLQTEVFVYLFNKYHPRFATFYLDTVDKVSHLYWQYYEPEKFRDIKPEEKERYKNVVRDFYVLSDWSIGQILDNVDEQTTIILVSDHGFKAISDHGFKAISDHGFKTTKGKRYANSIVLKANKILELTGFSDRLRAFKVQYSLYLRAPDTTQDSAAEIMHQARNIFQRAVHQPTGARIFSIEEEEDGSFSMRINTNIELRPEDLIRLGDQVVPLKEITDTAIKRGGTHDEIGIFLIKCPVCQSGTEISKMSVKDVTPTLLYRMGLPIGQDMDGQVIKEVFRPEYVSDHPVKFIATYDRGSAPSRKQRIVRDKELEKTLRSLGYIE